MKIAIVASLVLACGTPTTTGTTGTTSPTPGSATSPAPGTPAIAVAMTRRGGGDIAAGSTVKTGELVELWVTPSQRGYLYVVQFFSDGTYDLLFPSSGIAEQVDAASRLRVPKNPGGWLKVTGDSAGEEHVHVLFTASPLATISPALAGGLGLAADARAAPTPTPTPTTPTPTPPDPIDAGVTPPARPPSPAVVTKKYTTKAGSAPKQQSLLMTYDRGSKALTEIVIDDQPVSLAPSSGITVQTFWYVHAP